MNIYEHDTIQKNFNNIQICFFHGRFVCFIGALARREEERGEENRKGERSGEERRQEGRGEEDRRRREEKRKNKGQRKEKR